MAFYGCDIGNGFGMLSLLEEGAQEPQIMLPALRTLNAREGMPTAAYVTPPDAEPIRVFDTQNPPADRLMARDPEHVIRAAKTHLREDAIALPGIPGGVAPYDVYRSIARDLISLGNYERAQQGRDAIYQIVLTYPASIHSWTDYTDVLGRMQKAIEDVEIDGHHLEVLARIPEPAAAAIDYLYYLQDRNQIHGNEFCALVYDLGYGTFDLACVVAKRDPNEPYDVLCFDGIEDVGGKDFDERIREEFLAQISDKAAGYQPVAPRERDRLLHEAVTAKHILTDKLLYDGTFTMPRNASQIDLALTRERFEEITKDLLNQTLEKTQSMIEEVRGKGRTIDAIVLTGGASQMPMVKEALEVLADGEMAVYGYHFSTAVSFGAARYVPPSPRPALVLGGDAHRRRATLRATHTLGVLAEHENALMGEVKLLVRTGSGLPASAEIEEFFCPDAYYDVRVYQPDAEHENAQADSLQVDQCESIRWLHFSNPHAGIYKLVLTEDANYDISVELIALDGWSETQSTAARRGGAD